jgi:hypothetical protein
LGLQRAAVNSTAVYDIPPIVDDVLRSSGQPLDAGTRVFMESRFGHDFSQVRVHTDTKAATSARAMYALAYTLGHDVVFGSGQYAPHTSAGQRLVAHELTHVVQQSAAGDHIATRGVASDSSPDELEAASTAEAVLAGRALPTIAPARFQLQRQAAPYIKRITVHLTPPQSADLEWRGTAPTGASGSDHFTVSTGKGYGDPLDPRGTCTRSCCTDPMTQCAPPWNQPGRVGACCTYHGNSYWTGTPLAEHNTWKWWTPIQPYYSSRGIALHQHPDVTGQPIGHGCVRMLEPNAKRIHDYSNGRQTNVTIDGRAAPVACDANRRCSGAGETGGATGQLGEASGESQLAQLQEPVPGLEGVLT